MKNMLILLMLLSFACKKKTSKEDEQQSSTAGTAQSNERTVSILVRPQGTDNVVKINWDFAMNGPWVDSVYIVPHSGATFVKKITADSIMIKPLSKYISGGYLLTSSVTVTVDGIKIKDTANLSMNLIFKIK